MAIFPGGACCLLVPNTATRVVVEMWGQGGGGGNSCCCTWGQSGGKGGNYAYKVWSTANSNAPSTRGACMSFCGCVCACDCQSDGNSGSPGQFSNLYDCTGYWYGCVQGGTGGVSCCTATCWWACGSSYNCNTQYDACNLFGGSSASAGSCYALPSSESQGNNMGPSCVCGGTGICLGSTLPLYPIGFTTAGGAVAPAVTATAVGPTQAQLDAIFVPYSCSCFDFARCGACGFTNTTYTGNGVPGSCDARIGVGGAAYAGGAQQQRSGSPTTFYYCGLNGNFPGGGGRGGGAFGGGCCYGGAGGGGLILISYKI